MCFKYLVKGGTKLLKCERYDQLIDQVLGKRMVTADPNEIELANQLLMIKKINVRRLLMEIKQLKEFGKELGLKLAQMNKLDEESLILELIRNVEPKIKYSKELVTWYNKLDDALFDQAEATSGAEATSKASTANDSGIPIADVIELIEGYSKKDELLAAIEDDDVAPFFEGFDGSTYKLPTQLKKAMITHLNTPAEPESEVEAATDDQMTEIVELINECENEDQLVEVYSEYQTVFESMDVPDDIDAEALQEMMLNHLKLSEPEPEKPMTLRERLAAKKAKDAGEVDGKATAKAEKQAATEAEFDWWNPEANDFSADDAFALAEEMKMTTLRKFAKFIGLSIGIGKKKEEILDIVANKIAEFGEGVAGSTENGEVAITAELIKDAVKGKDRDALVEMCDQLGIALNALQKKSVPGMEKKLLAAIEPAVDEKTEVKAKGGKTKLSTKDTPVADQSVYSQMENMVLDGQSEDKILKAVSPIYKEKGKSIIFIKKRVQSMIQIIKIDNDIE
jgi:hypothetical protein